MSPQWRDVSMPISAQMTLWPGDPPFVLEADSRIAAGDSCNVSKITLCTHTGTHCDAPWHFVEEGKKLDEVDTSLFFGKALLIELLDVPLIKNEHLPEAQLPERVLFKTGNSLSAEEGVFNRDFVALDVSAAERLAADGVKLVGIDYLSISPYGNSGPVHRTLLEAEVLIIEGLQLKEINAGTYDFVVLPLPLVDADGAPCRAFIYA